MPGSRYMLALADSDAERKRALGGVATASDFELVVVPDVTAGVGWLETHDPHAVVFDTHLPKSEKLLEKVRSKKTLSSVPIIGLTAELNDALVPRLYGMGADDVVPIDSAPALLARLRALPRGEALKPPPPRGAALIADVDRARCDVFGRTLTNAGYDVKHAYDERALRYYINRKEIRVVVANSEIASRGVIEHARKQGSEAVWVVTAQRRDLAAQQESLAGLERVTVVGVFAPPENVLFASNELLGADTRAHQRKSVRILHGTVVTFRSAGGERDETGFTYNVSGGGLYVRTLLPVEEGAVWLEVTPPRGKRKARLEGRVAWKRGFGFSTAATVPPGFGIELTGALGDGLAQWTEGYAALAQASGASTSIPPHEPGVAALGRTIAVTGSASDMSGAPTQPAPVLAKPAPRPSRSPTPVPESISPPPVPGRPQPKPSKTTMIGLFPSPVPEPATLPPAANASAANPLAATVVAEPGAPATRPMGPPPLPKRDEASPEPPRTTPMGAAVAKEASPQPPATVPIGPPPLPERGAGPPAAADRGAGPPPLPERAAGPPTATEEAGTPPQMAAAPDAASIPALPPPLPALEASAGPALAIGRSGASDELASPASAAATSARVASSRSTIVAVGAVLGFIVIVGGVLAAVKMGGQPPRTAAPAQSAILAATPASANVSPPAPTLTTPATVAAAPRAPAPTPSAAAPAPSGAASVATASGSAPAVDESGGDGSDLPNNMGYLLVTSNADADVYVTGVKVGVTNAKNKTACHLKFVRLGRGTKAGPSWISKGQTVNVKCQQVTRVEIEQDPHPD